MPPKALGNLKTTLTRMFTQLMPNSFTPQFVFFVCTQQVKKYWTAVFHPFDMQDPEQKTLEDILELDTEPKTLEEILQIEREKVQLCKLYNAPYPSCWELKIVVDECGRCEAYYPNLEEILGKKKQPTK